MATPSASHGTRVLGRAACGGPKVRSADGGGAILKYEKPNPGSGLGDGGRGSWQPGRQQFQKNFQKIFSVALRARIGSEWLDWPSSGLLLLATGNKTPEPDGWPTEAPRTQRTISRIRMDESKTESGRWFRLPMDTSFADIPYVCWRTDLVSRFGYSGLECRDA